MKYYIVDCISGYHDEEDTAYTSLKKACEECRRLNEIAVSEGHSENFWIVIDKDGNEMV